MELTLLKAHNVFSGVMKLRAVFRKRYNYFDAQGYRRRVMPKFWLLTIPEYILKFQIGHFHSEFKEFNETIIRHSSLMRSVHILDWAGAVKMSLPAINWSQFNTQAVEKRLNVLFHLCRQELDVYYIRSDNEIKLERSSGYWNSIGYHGEDHSTLRVT
uniref:AAA_lid_7 domain-containing protein n=1 Tax=Heterorhabditis bacteriophora TaxID=37862 RepID=A0A1I7WEB9_HETBA